MSRNRYIARALERALATEAEGRFPNDTRHRQVKYLDNVVEAAHGKLNELIRPVRGFKPMKTACATIKGLQVTRALRKGQVAIFSIQCEIVGEARIVIRVRFTTVHGVTPDSALILLQIQRTDFSLDSRFRGNDDSGLGDVIPAKAGIQRA